MWCPYFIYNSMLVNPLTRSDVFVALGKLQKESSSLIYECLGAVNVSTGGT